MYFWRWQIWLCLQCKRTRKCITLPTMTSVGPLKPTTKVVGMTPAIVSQVSEIAGTWCEWTLKLQWVSDTHENSKVSAISIMQVQWWVYQYIVSSESFAPSILWLVFSTCRSCTFLSNSPPIIQIWMSRIEIRHWWFHRRCQRWPKVHMGTILILVDFLFPWRQILVRNQWRDLDGWEWVREWLWCNQSNRKGGRLMRHGFGIRRRRIFVTEIGCSFIRL